MFWLGLIVGFIIAIIWLIGISQGWGPMIVDWVRERRSKSKNWRKHM